MATQAVDVKCPGCGAPVSTAEKTCKYCRRPIVISTFNSVNEMPIYELNKYSSAYKKMLSDNPDNAEVSNSLAICYLKLKLYDKAFGAFEKAIEDNFDNAETYFYAAVCLLKGKKAFLASRQDINRAEEYINAALAIEPRGIFYYFLAYIKFDYFERKYLNTTPDYRECLENANKSGLSPADIKQLFDILNVSVPNFE